MSHSPSIQLGPDSWITVQNAMDIVRGRQSVELSDDIPTALPRAQSANTNDGPSGRVYGVDTGFGSLASRSAHPDTDIHQRSLIYHLATGTGPPLPNEVTRAMVLDRLITLSKGHSRVGRHVLFALKATLDGKGPTPRIPSYGSVGASGDLTPLAHLALGLADQGLVLENRDALGLVNGCSASLGLVLLSWSRLARYFSVLLDSAALMVRAMGLAEHAFSHRIHELRQHPGQMLVAEQMRLALAKLGTRRRPFPPADTLTHERTIQAAYSFRCIPQVLGPVAEYLSENYSRIERELNAVTDNPIIDNDDSVLHGGNFHGEPIAFIADALGLCAGTLAQIADRQLARICDERLNHGLPAYLSGADQTGSSSGLMGAQVSATALAAEVSARGRQRYVLESRSTNGANQDIVSMSTLAGLSLYDSLPRLGDLVAIHCIAAAAAADQAAIEQPGPFYDWIRGLASPLQEDRPLAPDIAAVAAALHTEPPDFSLWSTIRT